jgi:hypothetical protein
MRGPFFRGDESARSQTNQTENKEITPQQKTSSKEHSSVAKLISHRSIWRI